MSNKKIIIGFVLLAAAGLVIAGAYSRRKTAPAQTTDHVSADSNFLRSEMKLCSGKELSDNCYRQVADFLMAKWPYPKTLQLLKDNEQFPEIFGRCHQLTHYLGRLAYEQEQSVAKVYAQASPVCWGGFYHGVMEAYFQDQHLSLTNVKAPAIAAALKIACGQPADYSSPRFYSECIHGIGHAMMFITNTNLNKSLALCDQLATSQSVVCYGGVFMENSSSSTNTAHPTKFLKAADPMYPCNSLAERYLDTCYQYQSSYFAELSRWDWKKNGQLCEQVPMAYQVGCFRIIGSNQVGSTQNYETMKDTCSQMAKSVEIQNCILGVVSGLAGRYVNQVNKVGDFCSIVDSANQQICFQELGLAVRSWTSDSAVTSSRCAELKQTNYIVWCQSASGSPITTQSFN